MLEVCLPMFMTEIITDIHRPVLIMGIRICVHPFSLSRRSCWSSVGRLAAHLHTSLASPIVGRGP